MLLKKLNIAYLGRRDYIDVSTLTSALYEALPHITDNAKIKNFNIKILRKVLNECDLWFADENKVNELVTLEFKKNVVATFDWEFEGVTYFAFFKETNVPIVERRNEIVDDPKELMFYEKEAENVVIFNPINSDSIYNFMKMGRLIVVNKYNLFPRVVRAHFDCLYNQEEMKGVVMTGEFFAAKDFYKLETFKDGKKFGEIIIKALQPY